MSNIRIIKTGINVSKILKQLQQHPTDWDHQKRIEDIGDSSESGWKFAPVGTLQLVMGGVTNKDEFVGNTEICISTRAIDNHTEVVGFMKRNFKKFSRCGFLALPVGERVEKHIDHGTYYLTRDRYHLSIQGTYRYFCGDAYVDVEPGTLLWFNNKLMHGTENTGDCTRITFVFDVPHSKSNP